MEYRILLFKNDKYIERIINLDKADESVEKLIFSRIVDDGGRERLTLPTEYEAVSTIGREIIKIGNDASCSIRPLSDVPNVIIAENYLESEGEVFVNGNKTIRSKIVPGDKILINTTELIYHNDWIEICGIRGKTYETDLISYIGKPDRFEEYPIYKRSPRIIKSEPYVKVQIKIPEKREKQKKGELVKRILPSCVMIIATVLMSIFMNRGLFMLVMVAATGATMIVTVVTYFDDKKNKAAENRENSEAYKKYLLAKRKELYERTKEFKEAKIYQNLSLKKIENEVSHYTDRIYERNFNDDDFLSISLGTAPGIPSFKIECDYEAYGRAGDDLYKEMLAVYKNFKTVNDIPYIVDLKKSHLGIVGRPDYCRSRLEEIVTKISFFHSYHDVCIVAVVGEENKEEYEWMRWLPHTEIKNINVSGVITGENQRDQVLGHLTRELKARSMTRDESKKENRFIPHYVFLIDDSKLIINHSIMEHLKEEGGELGFSLIYITQIENNLPENVKTILEIEAKNEGRILMDEGVLVNRKIQLDEDKIDYDTLARRLKPIVHNKGVTTQIPENISFLELYGAKTPDEIDIRSLWKRNATYKSLSVPLGLRGKGDVVNLDLHEKAHGPHGLVAGTTGSGKSEILQSYILSLACNFHPHDVGFLLIDYKGGGMANLFRNLPHLLGTITNLDGAESMRALASIKSELKRRQDVFNRNGVNNINKYSEKFRAGHSTEPMPHLFIISDEFAELKKEQPEFMAELVSTARVGRSLGVHLILATQKPSGIVDDQIWSNSRFKLCLKVQNDADSRELLRSGDAANITQPGRAYLQVGNNEIYELFQSAYSGGTYSEEAENNEIDDRIYVLNELGQGRLINEDLSVGESNDIDRLTQLDAVVKHIKAVYQEKPCQPVAKPWLPPLAEQIVNPEICKSVAGKAPNMSYSVGVIDMPDKQMQEIYYHDFLKSGNLAVFGTSRVGKSTVATNAILSLAAKNSPDSLNIYIVDFGNAALFALKDLPQIADYISFDDAEKFRKLRKILSDEISERKRKFARANVTTLEMYNATSNNVMPAILVVIDNYDVIKEIDFDLENYFTQLTRDGLSVGIYTLTTATRANAMKYAVLNNFGVRICNFMSDSSEVTSLIGRSEYKLSDIKGRALVSKDNIYLMQEYLPVSLIDAVTYRNSINEMVKEISSRHKDKARAIPMLPDKLEYDDLLIRKGESQGIALGLDSEDVSVRFLPNASPFLIVGGAGTGKSNVLRLIYSQIKAGEIFLVDSRSEDFYDVAEALDENYLSKESDLNKFMSKLAVIVEERFRIYEESDKTIKSKDFYAQLEPGYILIDDFYNISQISGTKMTELSRLIEKALFADIRVIASCNVNQLSIYSEIQKVLKNTQHGLILGNNREQSIFPIWKMKDRLDEDCGVLCALGSSTKIKIPLAE